MDVVIPLGPTRDNFEELRYALRGIEQHLHDYDEIYIIGEKPSWIQGVIHVPHGNDPDKRWKERNIWKKIMAACLIPELSQDFFMFNDDLYLLEDISTVDYPYYHKGTLEESMRANVSGYRASLHHSKSLLERRRFETLNADTHAPIIYNKSDFLNTFDPEDWNTAYGYVIKSVYCAFHRKPLTFMPDSKIGIKYTLEMVEKEAQGRHVISSTDSALKGGLGEFLKNKFPTKSSYERA